ncbi:hypothetical protein Tco_1178192 [Tanacetum coccineum]
MSFIKRSDTAKRWIYFFYQSYGSHQGTDRREAKIEEGQLPLLEFTRDRVVSLAGDEGVNIVADEGVEATAADKPKRTRKKRKTASGASSSVLPLKRLREEHDTSGDAGASTARKSLAVLQDLLDSSTLATEVGVTAAVTVPFVTSSMTPTPERERGCRTVSIFGPNFQTRHPAERFVISLDSSHHSSTNAADDEVTSIVRDFASPSTDGADIAGPSQPAGAEVFADTFYVSQDMDSETLQQDMDYEQLFVEFNVRVARQACFSVEVRLRYEHNYRERKKFERKCNRQADLLKEKDTKIANLQAHLSLKEAEAAKAIRLQSQLSYDELSIKAASFEYEKDKLTDQVSLLETTCSGLRDQVSGYELFKEQIEAVQDEQVKILSDKVTGLDAELMGMALHLDEEFYSRFLTTISGRRWSLGHGLRLVVMKCLQSLEYLVALGRAIDHTIDKGMQDGLV